MTQMVTQIKKKTTKKKKTTLILMTFFFIYNFVSLLGVSFMNRGLLGTKSGDKGEKNKSGPIYVTFIFLLSDTFISAGVSTHMEMDGEDK